MLTAEQQAELETINEQRKSENLEPLTELPAKEIEVSDDVVFAALSKKLGKPVSSYEDLLPKAEPKPEDVLKAKEERETKKTAWALQNNKVSEKQLKEFIKESETPDSLVLANFIKGKKESDPDADDEDLKEEFASIKKRLGEDQINAWGETLLKEKYPELYSLENDYSAYEETERNNLTFSEQVKTKAPEYIAANNNLLDTYAKDGFEVEVPVVDGKEAVKFKYTVSKDVAEKLKAAFNADDKVKDAIKNGYDKEKQSFLIRAAAINLDVAGFAQQIAQQTLFNREALLRGIPPNSKIGKTEIGIPEEEARLSGNKKIAKEYFQNQ